MIRLIVGLGNPGTEYERTRHNVGFWWIEGAARQLRVTLKSERAYHGLMARVNRRDAPLFLLAPQTYMNLSGKSVAALARFYKIAPGEMLVVHDEIDLPPGQMKLKLGGGVAGHNGLKDIQAQLGSADFWRLRIGVGHPGDSSLVADYVLNAPPPAERELIEAAVRRGLEVMPLVLADDMPGAMHKLHSTGEPRKAKPAQPPPEGDRPVPQDPEAKE